MMLAIRPDLVKEELPRRDGTHPDSEYADRVSQFLRMDEMTEQGIYGDPTYGSAEKGERMFEAIAGCLADIVGDLQGGRF